MRSPCCLLRNSNGIHSDWSSSRCSDQQRIHQHHRQHCHVKQQQQLLQQQQQQQQQQQWVPHQQPRAAFHGSVVVCSTTPHSCSAVVAAVSNNVHQPDSTSQPEQEQQPVRPRPRQQQEQRHAEQLVDFSNRRGRLLIKQRPSPLDNLQHALPSSLHQLRGSLPRGAVDLQQLEQQQQQQQQQQQHDQLLQQHSGDVQQQQQQQEQQPEVAGWSRQSVRDKNLSFSGALRNTKTLEELLELLQNPQWGLRLCDLDGVSVVGALVWLVKSTEWQQLQQHGSVGQQQWAIKKQAQHHIQTLLDRAEQLVLAQSHTTGTSSSTTSSSSMRPNSSASTSHSPAVQVPPSGLSLIRPAELANLIYCSSKLGQQRPQLLTAAAAGLQLDLYACSTLELNRLIWGLAHTRVNPGEEWLLSFCKAAQAKLFGCSPSQLSTFVYGLARLGYRPPEVWIVACLEASLALLAKSSAQDLANSAWGLSCFRFQAPPGWLSEFYTATSAAMSELEPQGFSQLAIALVTLGGGQPPPEPWTQQLLSSVQPLLGGFELLQLCNMGWALAHWQQQPDEQWMGEWVDASLPLLPAATPIDLSVLLWSCYKLSFVPPQRWLEGWFASTAASLPRCEPLQLSTIAFVLGEWGLVPTPGFSIDYWRASKSRFKDFTPYQMSVLLSGLAKARRAVPTTWATALIENFTQQLPDAEPGDVCRLISALSKVVVKPRGSAHWVASTPAVQQQLQQVVAWLVPQLGNVEPAWMVQLVPGLAKLRCVLGLSAVQELNDAAARMDERLTPGQRKLLAGSFGKLRKLLQQQPQQQQPRQPARAAAAPLFGSSQGGDWLPQQTAADADLW